MQGDTFLIQLFMVEGPERERVKSATFVGELRVRWKQCVTDVDAKNQWQHQQVALTDEDSKAQRRPGAVLSCQINIEVRYLEAGQRNSKFTADGSLKPEKPRYGDLQKAEVKHDHAALHVGSAGTLLCNPMFMEFAEASGMAFDPEPT